MTENRGSVSPPLAVMFGAVGFFALVVAGFGLTSLSTGAEVLPVSGLGQVPGVVAVTLSVAAFAATLWSAVRAPHPSFWGVTIIAAASFLAYLAGVLAGAVLSGVELARTIGAIGGFATSWFAVVLASAALIAGWAGIALVRTRASRPRWPWENDAH